MAKLITKTGKTIEIICNSHTIISDVEIFSIDHQAPLTGYYYIGEDGKKHHTWDFEESIGE